jgi:hypothetical protein
MHGLHVEAEARKSTEYSVAKELLTAADEVGARLIVAGGYGHSRLREWVLGGVTQDFLQTSTKCVFFGHRGSIVAKAPKPLSLGPLTGAAQRDQEEREPNRRADD